MASAPSTARDFNDGRRSLFHAAPRPIAFLCESPDSCHSSVVLTREDYDSVRSAPPGLVLCAEHRKRGPSSAA